MATNTLGQRKEAASTLKLSPNLMSSQTVFWGIPLVCSLSTGAMLWLCHFPMAWGWLAWVALVPMLFLVRLDLATKEVCWLAWFGGVVFYLPAIQWMRVADYRMYATWLGLVLYCSLFVPLGIYIVRRLDRKTQLPLVVTFPAVWTALEYFRAHFLTGFPWYFLGHTQHDFLVLAQIADIGGGYMVTFLVAGVNALVFEAVWQTFSESRQPISIRHLLWQTLAMVVALAGTLAYGLWRLHQENFTPGPRVALIQGSLDQRIRNAASEDAENAAVKTMQHHFGDLSNLAAAAHPKADLIVWSETSYPDARNIERDALRWGTRALLGLNSIIQDEGGKERQYNSALMVYADGSIGPRYDKIHRVPFGEYVPMKDWLPFMNVFAPYDYEYGVQAGTQMTQFSLGNFHFGALICYEDTDPALARQYVSAGDFKADFLVNISNDGWFDGTSEHEEHLAICRFRAIECRRAVARAVNMGVSAIIDGGGRVLQPKAVQPTSGSEGAPVWEVNWCEEKMPELEIGEWRRFKKVAGVLIGSIPIDQRFSLYAQWGDWFPQGCWLVVILGLIWSFIVRPAK